jgi:hypothetical protein
MSSQLLQPIAIAVALIVCFAGLLFDQGPVIWWTNVAVWTVVLLATWRNVPTPPRYPLPILWQMYRRIVWMRRVSLVLDVAIIALNASALWSGE